MRKIMLNYVALMLVGGLALMLFGCQATDSGSGTRTQITVGEAVDFASFDPYGEDGQGFYHYCRLVYETLVSFEDGKAVPLLAESWENDGNTWTFKLREGVTFTDGADFNAAVVKQNMEAMQTYNMEMISCYGGVARIVNMDVIDEYTISFQYDEPYYAVLEDLSAMVFGMVSPNLFADGNNPYGSVYNQSAGTGPYQLEAGNFTAGAAYSFTRNDDYYGTAPDIDSFTVKIIPDADSRMMALQSGEIDLLYGSYQVTYDMYDYLADLNGVMAARSDGVYATRNLLLNTASDLLGDPQVRQAIAYGTNKAQINNTILHGLEQTADTLFPLSLAYCDVDQKVYEYNPRHAASLLDAAGWNETNTQGIRVKDGQALSLDAIHMSERASDESILMAFKGQMAEIGIEINISGYETMTWYEQTYMGDFDITVNDTYGFPQDPHVFLAAMLDYGADCPAQQGLKQKPEIDAQISAMLTSTDKAVIQGAYTYVLSTLQEEAVNVPLSNIREIAVYNSELIENYSFADDPVFCDISRIKLK